MTQIKNTQAFTLVELIVVITILAILWTLWFISFQWYSMDARNSKKKSDISTLSRKIELERIEWWNIYSYIANTGSLITGSWVHIGWYGSSVTFPGTYNAGSIDYAALWVNGTDFKDTKFDDDYRMWVTSAGLRYEIAATIETAGDLDSYISGTWYERNSWNLRGERAGISGNIFYLSGAQANELGFYLNDLVGVSSGTYIIEKLVWNEIHLDNPITTPWDNIFLKTDESRHIIKKWDSHFPIDTGRWELYVPYN